MLIYVLDEHPLIQTAIAMLLRRLQPAVQVVDLTRLSELPHAVATHGPPVLICADLLQPAPTLEGIAHIRSVCANTPLLILSALPAAEMRAPCLAAGASAYLEKSAPLDSIVQTLRDWLPQPAPSATGQAPLRLSKRQQQLIVMLDAGLSNREIAEQLAISEHTVKVHLWRLFRRMEVKSRTQAVHAARYHGLLP